MFRILQATENFQSQRERIISDLSAKIQILDLDVTLVFDAKYQRGGLSRSHKHPVEIFFTAEGETADEFILNEIKSERKPSGHTVVTSDKMLAYLARLHHSHAETVEHFISWLNRRYKNKLLRPEKEIKTTTKENKLTAHEPAKTLKKPPLASSPVECFDFYLSNFEKRLKEQVIEDRFNIVQEIPKKKKLKSHQPEEDDYLSDMQRWLKAFENNLQD